MKIAVLFRKLLDEYDDDLNNEFSICCKHLNTFEYRSQIPLNSLVVGRYSVLPYYKELEQELNQKNSFLVNTYEEHLYIADIRNYYEDIKEFTPKTYTLWDNLPKGSYVVKGITNSRKHQWNTHMFAKTKEDVPEVVARLFDDQMILHQGVVVRDYVPLRKLADGINGLPISEEYRLFFLGDSYLAGGFYWSYYEHANKMEIPKSVIEYGEMIAEIISQHANFFVIDIGVKENGELIVVECNCGEMSGLSTIDPNILYENLECELERQYNRTIEF